MEIIRMLRIYLLCLAKSDILQQLKELCSFWVASNGLLELVWDSLTAFSHKGQQIFFCFY